MKNSPRVYFSPKENYSSLPVRCFSRCVKKWRMVERMNLLKKMISSMVNMVAARAFCYSTWAMCKSVSA